MEQFRWSSARGAQWPRLLLVAANICANYTARMKNPFDVGYYESAELRSFGFGRIGANVSIAKNCTIVGLHNISIGNNVRIDSDSHLIASSGSIRLGSYIHIGGGSKLNGRAGIEMEDFSGLSQDVKVYSSSDDYTGRRMTNPMVPPEYTGARSSAVHIGRHAIIGSGSIILPGASVGEGAAVGALTLVTRALDPWAIYSGNPARRIRERSRSLLALEAKLMECPNNLSD